MKLLNLARKVAYDEFVTVTGAWFAEESVERMMKGEIKLTNEALEYESTRNHLGYKTVHLLDKYSDITFNTFEDYIAFGENKDNLPYMLELDTKESAN